MAADHRHVPWVGINHLALITTDMDQTVRFWHGVLRAELVATIALPSFRHYFFRTGPTSTVAFFEYTDQVTGETLPSDAIVKPAGEYDRRAGQFDHLSLDLPDEAALTALQARLSAAGCEVTEVVDHRIVRSIYFTDPNGIALEASWWADSPLGAKPDFTDTRYFADPDPVPAVRELMQGGLVTTPATQLVSGASAS